MVEVKNKIKKSADVLNEPAQSKAAASADTTRPSAHTTALADVTKPRSGVIDDPIIIPGLDDKKQVKIQERVTLNESEVRRLDVWLGQIEKRFEGFIKLNKSDLVNFLIRRHPDLLSREELEKIKVENYNEAKFLRWAVQRLDDAKKNGEDLRLSDLFNAYRTVLDKNPVGAGRKTKDKNIAPISATDVAPEQVKSPPENTDFQRENSSTSIPDIS